MKTLFKASIFLGIFIFLLACKLAFQVTPVTSPSVTSTQTVTSIPIPSHTATITSIPTLAYHSPTLFPTIDPTSVPKLLSEALSLQTMNGANGHSIRQITGWEYGFRQLPCCGYQWLDSNHLLLYPRTGEGMRPFHDGERKEDLSSQPVIMNLETGASWLPWSNIPTSIYVSRELGIIFQQEAYGSATGPTMAAVSTFTFDGQKITHYWGKILGISPSGEKILVDDDTIIDLRNDKITDLAWHMDYDFESPRLYWSSDETRIYRCCFYFADLKTGKSYNLEWSDLRGADGKPVSYSMHTHNDGQWVRNDSYFLVKWDYWNVSYQDPIPIFSPIEKKYYDLAEMAGIPSAFIPYSTYAVSPDGMYVWVRGFSNDDGVIHSFLVNLTTFESTSYDTPVNDFFWSPDSKFGWTDGFDSENAYVLSVASKKLLPFPVNPRYEYETLWHPKDSVLAYTVGKDQTIALLNAKAMTVEEWKLPVSIMSFDLSPSGDRIRFTATDGSLWQVDYPKLENPEQLTQPLPDVHDVNWSPDGNSIAFISGSDIYIVDTIK